MDFKMEETTMHSLRSRLTRFALMLTVTAGALLAPKAHADFNVRNNYHRPVWVVFAYKNTDMCGGEGGDFRVMGWYQVAPGATRTLLNGSLLFSNKYLYVYAESDDDRYWGGDYYTEVNTVSGFDTCWDYGHSVSHGTNPWAERGFFEVHLGTLTSTHTVNLN
jgi:uncharacterized membrane protein